MPRSKTSSNGQHQSELELDLIQLLPLGEIRPAPENDAVYNAIAVNDPEIYELAQSIIVQRTVVCAEQSNEKERRKTELRARLKKELAGPTQTVKDRVRIESKNLSYWTSGGMSFLRRKFMIEAEEARERWAKLDPQGPNGARARRTVAKCDTPEGKDNGTTKCDIPTEGKDSRTPKCDIPTGSGTGESERDKASVRRSLEGPRSVSIPECDSPEGKDSQLTKCDIGTGSGGKTHHCRVCGKKFSSTRPDATLCSATCRKRASRAKERSLTLRTGPWRPAR